MTIIVLMYMTGDQEPNNSQADAEISLKKTTDFYFFTSIFIYNR